MSRTLVVIRHAQAEALASDDARRELTDRGREDAAEAGRWLAGAGVVPQAAYVSGAVRARQTWVGIATAAGWTLEPTIDSGLYGADEETVLDVLRSTSDDVDTVVLVGHNPTMAMVVQLLDDGEGPAEVAVGLAGDYPTCAATVFDVPVRWAELAEVGARPRAFHVGRA